MTKVSAKRRVSRTGSPKATASFIETMDCLPVLEIPEGPEWTYEIKLDGYRLEAVKSRGKVTLYSRRRNILTEKFGYIAAALETLSDETVMTVNSLPSMNTIGPTLTCFRIYDLPSQGSITTHSMY